MILYFLNVSFDNQNFNNNLLLNHLFVFVETLKTYLRLLNSDNLNERVYQSSNRV